MQVHNNKNKIDTMLDWKIKIKTAEKLALDNINNLDFWAAIEVVYSPPRVERLTHRFEDFRIHLHKIHETKEKDSFFHFHPWESAFKILSGGYEQVVGVGDTSKDFPEHIYGRFYMKSGSMYLMDNPQSWHRVMPSNKPSYSLMITTKAWPKNKVKLKKLMNKVSKREEAVIPIPNERNYGFKKSCFRYRENIFKIFRKKETLYNKYNQVIKDQNHYKWDLLYSHDSIWFHTLENTSVEDVISLHIYAPGNYLPN